MKGFSIKCFCFVFFILLFLSLSIIGVIISIHCAKKKKNCANDFEKNVCFYGFFLSEHISYYVITSVTRVPAGCGDA